MTNLDTHHLSHQELCVGLEEFERNVVDVSDLLLSLLENHLDRTLTCAAAELGTMRFAVFVCFVFFNVMFSF